MTSTPGITGWRGKWPWKKADRHVLDADRAAIGDDVDDTVDHQERVAMRDHLHHPHHVQGHAAFRRIGSIVHPIPPKTRVAAGCATVGH
jgi:hypothetical protein